MKSSEEFLVADGNPILEPTNSLFSEEMAYKVISSDLKKVLGDLMIKIDEKLKKLNPKRVDDYGNHCYYTGMKACVQMILDSMDRKENSSNEKTQ